jgi:hypothetical protein
MNLIRVGLLLMLLAGIAQAQEKTRVYINESQSWEMTGGIGGSRDGFGGSISGGARPQTAEIIKTFNERCPTFTITNKEEKANYTIMLHHEGGKDLVRRDNKFAVYNKDGDVIASGSTRSLGNAVKNACLAIDKDLQSNPPKTTTADN